MELTVHLIFIIALLTFLIALQTRTRAHAYVGASMLLFVVALPLAYPEESPAAKAADEYRTESTLIGQSAVLAQQAHHLLSNIPRTKDESKEALDPSGDAARFFAAEQAWLVRAEHGKPLDAFVDHSASTAAIRIVAVDSFLTDAVESGLAHCNDHDSQLNIDVADRIIADAQLSLNGKGDPHFPTPDLSRQLDDSDNCIQPAD